MAIAFLTSVAKMANVFNVRGGHALVLWIECMHSYACLWNVSIADYHNNLKKKSGMQRSVPQASDWPNTGRKL